MQVASCLCLQYNYCKVLSVPTASDNSCGGGLGTRLMTSCLKKHLQLGSRIKQFCPLNHSMKSLRREWRHTHTHTHLLDFALASSATIRRSKIQISCSLLGVGGEGGEGGLGNIFGCTWNGQFVDEDACYAKGNDKWPKRFEKGQALLEVRDGCLGEAHGNHLSLFTVCLK